MDWETARQELLEIAGNRSTSLDVDDYTFVHNDGTSNREIVFTASVYVDKKWIQGKAASLRLALDELKMKLEIGKNVVDPDDRINPPQQEAAAI